MALTRLRADQISDIDYKQAVRVVTVSNVALTGGAPLVVDGVTLLQNNRVLVTGQSSPSQNGLFVVQTPGTGSDGTWIRSSDANTSGEIEAGMIVMVTEGAIYADTQWKLTTNDPIVLGATALIFTQNYLANSISTGNSNVVVNTSNVTIGVSGNNIATFDASGLSVTGTVSASGNITSAANISSGNLLLTGNIVDSGPLSLVTAGNGNVNLAPNGTNVLVVTTTGANITGTLNATGNASVGNLAVTSVTGTAISVTGTVTAASTVGGVITGSSLSTTGNIIGGNISTSGPSGSISGAGNITAGNLLTGGQVSATATVTGGNLATGGTISGSGNITGGNLLTAGQVSATGNITTSNFFIGNGAFLTGIVPSSVDAGNLIGNTLSSNVLFSSLTSVGTLSALSVAGNLTSGNITSLGQVFVATGVDTVNIQNGAVSASGNITASGATINGDLTVTGNATLSGNIVGDRITNGTTNIEIQTANGNANVTVGGVSNVAVFTTGGIDVTGNVSATGNITGGNIVTSGAGGDISGTGNVTAGGYVSATGNVIAGNILFGSGIISGTGNIYADQIFANIQGNLSAPGTNTQVIFNDNNTANATAGFTFDKTANAVTVLGNITGGNILTGGTISSTGNITVGGATINGDLTVTGNATLSGNIVGDRITNGTTTIEIQTTDGNANISVGGVSNVAVFTPTGVDVTGNITANGRFTLGDANTYFEDLANSAGHLQINSATDIQLNPLGGEVSLNGANLVLIRNAGWYDEFNALRVSIDGIPGNISAAGNVSAGNLNITGNIVDTGAMSLITGSSGNINLAPNGINRLTVTTAGANIVGVLDATGNIQTRGNVLIGGFDPGNYNTILYGNGLIAGGGNISASSSIIAGKSLIGENIFTAGNVSAAGNVTSGNVFTGGVISAAGNATAGNISTGGSISAAGNITVSGATINGDLTVTGNATLSGNIVGDRISNGNTSIEIQTQNGNANISVGGVSNVAVFTTGGIDITGNIIASGFASLIGNVSAANVNGVGVFKNGVTVLNADDTIDGGIF